MTTFSIAKFFAGRKVVSALAIAAVAGLALSPASASAKEKHHHGLGIGAAIVGGLVLGAIAADAASSRRAYVERECWTEKRKRFDAWGDVRFQKVRVCS